MHITDNRCNPPDFLHVFPSRMIYCLYNFLVFISQGELAPEVISGKKLLLYSKIVFNVIQGGWVNET